jgi:hypothetical protein
MEPDVMPGVHAHADRVHVPQLIGIAVVSACVGLGLVFAMVPRAPRHEAAQPTPIPAKLSEPSESHEETLPESASSRSAPEPITETRSSAATDAVPAPTASREVVAQPSQPKTHEVAIAEQAPKPVVPSHALAVSPAAIGSEHARSLVAARGRASLKPRAPRHFERGVVAYLRCDGLERHSKRFSCPRDRRLEASVWQALETLPQCRNFDPGAGQAELRLTIRKGGPMQVEMDALPPAHGLNLRAVIKCTGPSLVKLRSHLRTARTIVTFRFGLS